MKYNPKTHHRKSIRLKYYDYSTAGYYFITICTKNRKHILSKIINESKFEKHKKSVGADDPVRPKKQNYIEEGKLKLTKIGIIVEKCLKEIEAIYDSVKIDKYIIMPNHIHIIIILKGRSKPRPYDRRHNLCI